MTDRNTKFKTLKLLENNMGEKNPDDLGYGDQIFMYNTKDMIHKISNR